MEKLYYRVFLRILKITDSFDYFYLLFNKEDILFITNNNAFEFLSRIYSLIAEKYRTGNSKNAIKFYDRMEKVSELYTKVIRVGCKLIAHNYFNDRKELKKIINNEIRKIKYNDYSDIDEAIEDSYNTSDILYFLFNWGNTTHGREFWKRVDEDFKTFLKKHLE